MQKNYTANSKRIAKNTLLLYIRMLFTMGVSLYTSRIVLNTLGVEDFGIYNVVGGIVAMFVIVSGSLSTAISRFITFELGKGDVQKLKKIFSTSVSVQVIIALAVCALAEVVGVWFLNEKMNIPIERLPAANWILQCSILTFMINLISVPYNASIIAHEHMKAFAYISILEITLKLFIVYSLAMFAYDKLIMYALLLLLVAFIIRIVYGVYCKKKFSECAYSFVLDKSLLRSMLSFAGWNFIGSSSAVLRDQGVNIALNLFYGPIVNAARGISFQVNTAIMGFVNNFMMALNPQITKSYASEDREYMQLLIHQGARFSFYLLLFLSLPVFFEAQSVLVLWLNVVPQHTVLFVRLILIFAMCESLSGTLVTAMLATGKIRNYQIVIGGLQLLNFPVSYSLLYFGFFPEVTMIVAITISLICLFSRLLFFNTLIGVSVKSYIFSVLINILLVSVCSIILPLVIYYSMDVGLLRILIICFSSAISVLFSIYVVGCSKVERKYMNHKLLFIINKLLAIRLH